MLLGVCYVRALNSTRIMTTRRTFLTESARTAAGLIVFGALPARRGDGIRWRAAANPFTLGVASGDPVHDGMVLWTRVLPAVDGGVSGPVKVRWEIAEDETMRTVVKRGDALALPELAHSVHVEVDGLRPGRDYWYRFDTGGEASVIGHVRTAPPARGRVDELRFAFVSCQNWQDGYFTPLRHVADESLDFVVHLGDYIYEQPRGERYVRPHDGPEPMRLDQYRARYALYKSDPDLQAAHARHAFIVTWDDHEVQNNYADAIAADSSVPAHALLAKRAVAYQAYYEHMPIRRSALASGSNARLYRSLGMGDMAAVIVLDTRQYRTDQPCGDGRKPRCAQALDPAATITGAAQERWMLDELRRSPARWNIVAQQVPFAQIDSKVGPEGEYSMDKWDGYVAQRERISDFLVAQRPSNPVILTGDMHFSMVLDVKRDFENPQSPAIATELVGTSISSGGDGSDVPAFGKNLLDANAHMRFMNAQRGYVRCRLTPDRWVADYRIVPFVTKPDAGIETKASFVIENGRPGAQRG
jgi:alkaline phosphatase D